MSMRIEAVGKRIGVVAERDGCRRCTAAAPRLQSSPAAFAGSRPAALVRQHSKHTYAYLLHGNTAEEK